MDLQGKLDELLEAKKQFRLNENKIDEINTKATSKLLPLSTKNVTLGKTIESITDEMRVYMEKERKENGVDSEEVGLFTVGLKKKAWHVVIPESGDVPAKYKKVGYSVDKAAIKKALSDGEKFDFASKSEEEFTLDIKANI